jgi:hypothetical protein
MRMGPFLTTRADYSSRQVRILQWIAGRCPSKIGDAYRENKLRQIRSEVTQVQATGRMPQVIQHCVKVRPQASPRSGHHVYQSSRPSHWLAPREEKKKYGKK